MPSEQKTLIERIKSQFIETVFPARCMACPTETITPMGLCGDCWGRTHFFSGPVCDLCGVAITTVDRAPQRLICDDCDRRPPAWDRGRSAVAYEGVGRQVTMALKHSDRLDLVAPLARWMTGAGADMLHSDMLVIPVPLHWSRLLVRRYNQAAILAKHVGERIGADVDVEALKRKYATPALKGKTRDERHETLRDAISISVEKVSCITDRDVLLVDDVMTTGATLSACTQVCREAGAASVSVLTLARVARPE